MKTGWLKDKESWYYLDPERGIMAVGTKEIDGKNYFFSSSGTMQVGWQRSNDSWHYYATSGALQTGWIKDKGVWYYLNPEDGIMLVGLHKVNGDHYYFDESGAMQTGWKQLDGNWYYFQADGSLLKNATTPDGYKVNEEGIWKISQTTVAVEQDKKELITETSTSAENSSHVEDNSSHNIIEE